MAMTLELRPCHRVFPITYVVLGEALVVDGEIFDFAQLGEGEVLPRSAVSGQWLQSDVERVGGVLRMAILMPYLEPASEAVRFPAPVEMVSDGPVPLPGQGV